ncbi:hypothetical protein [Streptomyces sp. NPDC093094]|uniref:hypothetical protein n=1 Tax=Streptomyces sp. NPDC093094 TaxID=3366026 RepID=UPI00380994EA
MKQRGRHRRRRRGRALRAFLTGTALALTAAATMISASQATVEEDPGSLRPLAADGARLTEDLVPAGALRRLTASMGRPVGVATLLAEADRTLRPAAECTPAERAALPAGPAAASAHCWDASGGRALRPGAVTTSGDADGDGLWGAHRVVLAGRTAGERGTRLPLLSFVDADASGRLPYASALLVVPVDGGRDYRALPSDLSGLVWYRDKLLVAADDAVYVYDVNRTLRTSVAAPAVGRVPGGFSAHGLRYVLPAVGAYRPASGGTRLGALGLDRSTTPDTLVAAERTAPGSEAGTRLWRYPFGTDPARPGPLAADAEGRVSAVEAYRTEASDVRGVLAHRSGWYVSRAAAGDETHGTLWRQDTDGARAARCGSESSPHCWSPSAASLSYWARTGEVWAQSGRMLFSVPLPEIDRALR